MALGLELKLRMGLQLVMTPQLQMAIRLLQMSSMDLAEYLQEELERNPLLERVEEGADEGSGNDLNLEGDRASGDTSGDILPDDMMLARPQSESLLEGLPTEGKEGQLDADLPVDASWSDIYADAPAFEHDPNNSNSSEAPPLENTLVRSKTLADHLMWQLGLSAISEKEQVIGTALIDGIDDNGYLVGDLESFAEMSGYDVEEVEDALILVQSFEPAGVGARNLAECLRLQLKNLGMAHTPYTDLLDHLDDLGRRDFRKLARILKLDEHDLADAVSVIHSLNPKPGLAFGSDNAGYVAPDVFVRKINGEWVVEVNPETVPKLRLNKYYQDAMDGRLSPQDKRFLAENARSAQWLIKSLEQRSSTIFRVAESIVRFQKDFLEYGQEHLKPLILKHVAEDVGVHESTTSRVTSNKYMHTPRGIFELKYFFSSSLASNDSDETHSSEAVKYKIRKLVESESARRPFSDEKIAKHLEEQGIVVARRTVAKYREAMGIPSSSRRKQISN
ncbi:MAG: RNA polymerase factor sigma-54 [Magnetococcus sp. DMHC-1]|nr:RNA polymerase factor sigma-54 [Magnetococcales bacterium]